MSMMNKKELTSWCLFDFANSTYSAVIAAAVFPVYYTSHIVTDGSGDLWWGRAISLSMLIVAFMSPVLGGIADYAGMRKRLMFVFTAACVLAVAALSLLSPGMALEGFLLIVIANVGMEGGFVFYNSYLNYIAPPEYRGRVSSWGFGVGYAGSIISLLMVLPLARSGMFGMSWIVVAVLFAVFSLPAFIFLPADQRSRGFVHASREGVGYIVRTLGSLLRQRDARFFLASFFLYQDGVSTVIIFSSVFAATTLGFGTTELVSLYIMVQAAALIGAFAMAGRTDLWGPRRVVVLSLVIWSGVCLASSIVVGKAAYWAIAFVAGLALGTVQAASRALFSRLVPPGKESECFGVYALAGKSSAIIGPLLFGYLSTVMKSQRPAVFAVALFFIGGLVLISQVRAGGPERKNLK